MHQPVKVCIKHMYIEQMKMSFGVIYETEPCLYLSKPCTSKHLAESRQPPFPSQPSSHNKYIVIWFSPFFCSRFSGENWCHINHSYLYQSRNLTELVVFIQDQE